MKMKRFILIGVGVIALLTTIMTVRALTNKNELAYNEYCPNGSCSHQNENGRGACGVNGNGYCQNYNANNNNRGCNCGCSRNR